MSDAPLGSGHATPVRDPPAGFRTYSFLSLLIEGMPKVSEHVFWHAMSGTLITSDLIFNIHRPVDTWTKLFFKLNGIWDQPGPTRIFRQYIKDKSAFKRSLQALRELPIQRIAPAHGAVIDDASRISHSLE